MEEQFAKLDIRKDENIVYKRTELLVDRPLSYCPGCGHGVVHRMLMETLEEMGIQDKTIGVSPVGCSVLAYDFMNIDMLGAAHGRAPALATAIKRMWPDRCVFTYQGDGDLASIGMGEIIHAAARDENITVIFINNANFGMTGGQMAPTTLPGMKTTSSSNGRDVETQGYPIKVAEMLSTLDGVGYCVRRSLHDPKNIRLAKKAIRTAFEAQARGLGFSIVELLSTCPTNWGMTPVNAMKFVEEQMVPAYPLLDYKISDAIRQIKI